MPVEKGQTQVRTRKIRRLVQTVYASCVAAYDLGLFLFRTVAQDFREYFPASGERGLYMRVVGAPQEVVDPFYMSVSYTHRVLLEADEHVLVKEVAG